MLVSDISDFAIAKFQFLEGSLECLHQNLRFCKYLPIYKDPSFQVV